MRSVCPTSHQRIPEESIRSTPAAMDAKKADSSKQVVHENKKNIQKGVERLERHSGTSRGLKPRRGQPAHPPPAGLTYFASYP